MCLMLMTKTQSEFLRKRAPLCSEEETPDDEPAAVLARERDTALSRELIIFIIRRFASSRRRVEETPGAASHSSRAK